MTRVYRILRKPFARTPLDGEGAYRFGGRWSSPGTRLVYAAEHVSLAMIEYFVHVELEDAPDDLVLVTAEVPARVSRTAVSLKHLEPGWRNTPAPPELALFGDAFVRQMRSAVLIVPSALAPAESNWLINPRHPDAEKIRVRSREPFHYDSRFFG